MNQASDDLTEIERSVLVGLAAGRAADGVASDVGMTVSGLGETLRDISRKNPIRSDRFLRLSPREWSVLLCLAEGKTNRQAALLLGITSRHVGNLVSSVFAKTDAASRADATAQFVRWLSAVG